MVDPRRLTEEGLGGLLDLAELSTARWSSDYSKSDYDWPMPRLLLGKVRDVTGRTAAITRPLKSRSNLNCISGVYFLPDGWSLARPRVVVIGEIVRQGPADRRHNPKPQEPSHLVRFVRIGERRSRMHHVIVI